MFIEDKGLTTSLSSNGRQ